MEKAYLQKLKWVASVFHADEAGNIFFGDEIIFRPQPFQKKETLTSWFAGFIYSNCYCRSNTSSAMPSGDIPDNHLGKEFLNRIIAANTSTDNNSERWQIIGNMPNGDPFVSKGADNFSIARNEVAAIPVSAYNAIPGYVAIKKQKDYYSNGDAFYHVFSENPESKRNGSILRFYWNMKAEGVPLLIDRLTSGFNRHFVPFQFKCLNNPALYSRHDSCVLYIFPKYLYITCSIIRNFHDEIKPFLKADVPMFTLKLCNGFSFAESPDGGESFGMQHATILSEALWFAFENRLDAEQRLTYLTNKYVSLGYDLTCLYKNPGSATNYTYLKQEIN